MFKRWYNKLFKSNKNEDDLIWIDPGNRYWTMDDNINRLIYVIARDDKKLTKLGEGYHPPRHCCPLCACPEYAELSWKQFKRQQWLDILKNKRWKRLKKINIKY